MGEALQLVVGGPEHGHAVVFGVASLLLQVFLPYQRYVRYLKWLTLALLAYVAVVFTIHVPWGEATFLLFSLGIIGTGMLTVPVLAGSAACAVADAFEGKSGLDLKLLEAREFYAIVALATLGGVALDFTPIDPFKALFWTAVSTGSSPCPSWWS